MNPQYIQTSLFAYETIILIAGTLEQKVCVDVNRKYRKMFQIKQ